MAAWCLTKVAEQKLLEALKEDGDPQKMVDRGSEGRLKWFGDLLGGENAHNLNNLFEQKMLLKSQVNGFKSFIARVGGSPEIKRDFVSKVERLQKALTKGEVDQYLEDYVSKRLGFEGLSENQYKVIDEMTKKISDYSKEYDPKTQEWASEEAKTMKGATERALENFVEDTMRGKTIGQVMRQRGGRFKAEFAKNPARAVGSMILDSANEIARSSTPIVATLDNSLFGRQGIAALLTGHPKLWARNFAKSFVDIVKEYKGQKTTDALLSDLYSNPRYMNGEYRKAGIIDVTEEQYPNLSLTERVSKALANAGSENKTPIKLALSPARILGRTFAAAEAAFKNGSLRMRTELYDMMANAKIDKGIEMTPEEIKGAGKVVNSILARGDIGRLGGNPIVRLMTWAPKMLKADLDILTAHSFEDIPASDRKVAFGNLAKIVAATFVIETVAGATGHKTELDPRSSDFLQIDGKYGFLRGMPALITLAARMLPQALGGGQYKNASGQLVKYEAGIGKRSRLDALISFLRGKAPPATGAVWDIAAGQDYSGNPPTFSSVMLQRGVPISMQNLLKVAQDPSVDNAMGWVADFLGLNSQLQPSPNIQSQVIPDKTVVSKGDFMSTLEVYAKAMGTDPETAMSRFLTGQKIMQVSDGGIIVVARQSVGDSQQFKKDWVEKNGGSVSDIKEVKLDHVVPNKLGGEEQASNWAVVPTSVWSANTKIEDTLIKAVKDKKLSLKDAQNLMKEYKNPGVDANGFATEDPDKEKGQEIIDKYK